MHGPRGWIAASLLVGVWLCVLAGSYAVGQAKTGGARLADAVVLHGGVPAGLLDTRAGAVAAAAEYAATVQRTSALDPALSARVVRLVYTPDAGRRVLGLASEARSSDPPLSGMRLLTAVAAARLDEFTVDSAAVGLWLEATYWSAAIEPTQTWALEQLKLRWRDGRWLVASELERVAPVPVWATVRDRNDTSKAFDVSLAGMRDVEYRAP
jgi:hypothetical protein